MPDVLRIQDQCYTDIVPESAQSLRAKVHASPSTCFVAESWSRYGFATEAPPHAGIAAKLASYGPGAQLMAAQTPG